MSASYVSWFVVALVAGIFAWVAYRQRRPIALKAVGYGLACVVVALLVGVMAGAASGGILELLLLLSDTNAGILGLAATRLLIFGYGVILGAIVLLVIELANRPH